MQYTARADKRRRSRSVETRAGFLTPIFILVTSRQRRVITHASIEAKRNLVTTPAKPGSYQLPKDSHGRAELDAAGFIRAEENDKRIHIKKFVENFTHTKTKLKYFSKY